MSDYSNDPSGVWRAEYEVEGLSCRAVAKRHGVPERLVYLTLRELGVDTGARTRERKIDRAAIAQARAAGRTPKQLAVEFKTSRAVIYNILGDFDRALWEDIQPDPASDFQI